MKSDIELYEGTGRLMVENYGHKPEMRQRREGSQEETSPLDPWLCIVGTVVLALLFLGVVYVAFHL